MHDAASRPPAIPLLRRIISARRALCADEVVIGVMKVEDLLPCIKRIIRRNLTQGSGKRMGAGTEKARGILVVQPERNASFTCWTVPSQPFPGRSPEVAQARHTGEADIFWYWQRSSPLAKALAELFYDARGSCYATLKFRNIKQKVKRISINVIPLQQMFPWDNPSSRERYQHHG